MCNFSFYFCFELLQNIDNLNIIHELDTKNSAIKYNYTMLTVAKIEHLG